MLEVMELAQSPSNAPSRCSHQYVRRAAYFVGLPRPSACEMSSPPRSAVNDHSANAQSDSSNQQEPWTHQFPPTSCVLSFRLRRSSCTCSRYSALWRRSRQYGGCALRLTRALVISRIALSVSAGHISALYVLESTAKIKQDLEAQPRSASRTVNLRIMDGQRLFSILPREPVSVSEAASYGSHLQLFQFHRPRWNFDRIRQAAAGKGVCNDLHVYSVYAKAVDIYVTGRPNFLWSAKRITESAWRPRSPVAPQAWLFTRAFRRSMRRSPDVHGYNRTRRDEYKSAEPGKGRFGSECQSFNAFVRHRAAGR
jgi:hypothetical protein